ncbi:ABC transporter permease subunit [Paenibacillus sp. TRM 82003]|nr:ABC transporter permease subunit [Paenibacillus sp. TRM 82003]
MTWRIAILSLKTVGYAVALFIIFGPLSSLVLWSIAEQWFWPHLLPQKIGFMYWSKVWNSNMMSSLGLSFGIAAIVTVLTLLLTVPLSYMLARFHIPAKALILMVFLLPQAFPQLPVYSNTMVLLYKWDLVGTIPGVILIHLVGTLVYAVWTMVSVMKSIPVSLEEAAMNVGASRLRVFMTVTLPLALPGILASSLLVFLYSLDEFTGSLLIGSPFVITMPVHMYNSAMGYEMQVASITALLLMLPGIVLLLLMEKFLKSEYLAAFGRA